MDKKQTMRYFRMGVGVSLTDAEANFILGASCQQAGALLSKLMQERGFCVDGDSYIPQGWWFDNEDGDCNAETSVELPYGEKKMVLNELETNEATDEPTPSRIIGGIEIVNNGWCPCFFRDNGVIFRERKEIKVKVNGTEYSFDVDRPEKDDVRELRVYSHDEDCISFLSENDDEPALLAENLVWGLINSLRYEYETNPDQWGRDHYQEVEDKKSDLCDLLEEELRNCLEYHKDND